MRLRGGAGAPDPLSLQRGGNLAAGKLTLACIADGDARARDRRVGVEEYDALTFPRASAPALHASRHDRLTIAIERRKRGDRRGDSRRENVCVVAVHVSV